MSDVDLTILNGTDVDAMVTFPSDLVDIIISEVGLPGPAGGNGSFYVDDTTISGSGTLASPIGVMPGIWQADIDTSIAALVDSSPGTLNTLNELAAALGDDPNFATTVATNIATKAPLVHNHAGADITSGTIADARLSSNIVKKDVDSTIVGNLTVTGQLKSDGAGADLVLGDRQNAHVSLIYRDDDITRIGGHTRAGGFTYPFMFDGDAQSGAVEVLQTGYLKFGHYTVAGYLKNDTSGNVTSTTIAQSDVTNLTTDISNLTTWVNSTLALYRTILQGAGTLVATRVAGTYLLGLGDAMSVTSSGSAYPLAIKHILSTDYPTINGKVPKFRIKAIINCNNVSPSGDFTFGLYPVTRPASSGGASLNIWTQGTVVTSSTVLFTGPVADDQLQGVSADFTLPADGFYVIGIVTTSTIAASSYPAFNGELQWHNA